MASLIKPLIKHQIKKLLAARTEEVEMEAEEQKNKPKVVKVNSKDSWDFHVNQANARGCPIVVHFGADWCVPSVAMNFFFEELASIYEGIVFVVADVDAVKEAAMKYEVKAVPTFLLLKGGAPVDKIVGANPDEIRRRVETFVDSTFVESASVNVTSV